MKINTKIKSHTKAFTLIELLVVIAIVSLLSSVVYASVSSAREKAQLSKASSQAREIKKATALALTSDSFNASLTNTDAAKSINDLPVQKATLEQYMGGVPKPEGTILAGGQNYGYYLFTGPNGAEMNYYPNMASTIGPAMCGTQKTTLETFEQDESIIAFRVNRSLGCFGPNNAACQLGDTGKETFYPSNQNTDEYGDSSGMVIIKKDNYLYLHGPTSYMYRCVLN
jgi:prepilin-type N-terminal cleavage/methylation domain-containing protein